MGKELAGKGKSQRLVVRVADETGMTELVFFRALKWVNESLMMGGIYVIFGKPNYFNGIFNFAHPEFEVFDRKKDYTSEKFMPMYNTSERMKNAFLASKQLSKIIRTAVSEYADEIEETLPDYLISAYHLISRKDALSNIHSPKSEELLARAKFRLKFELKKSTVS